VEYLVEREWIVSLESFQICSFLHNPYISGFRYGITKVERWFAGNALLYGGYGVPARFS
tara:strand:+ start:414 stop:590 length:177 start_codon:yes stop_codon:yes gene_type:complete